MASKNLPVTPPLGWTMDPEELDYEGEWATPNTWGYQLTANYNLGECTPIMCNPQEGELIFKGGGKFYQICQMGGDLFEITSPKTLDEIIAVVKGERRRKIKQNEETRLKSSHSPLLLSVDGWIAPTAKYTFKTQNLTLFGHGMGPAAPVAFTRVLLKLTPGSMCLKAKVEQMRIFMASRYSGKASEEPITKLISAGETWKGLADPYFNFQELIRIHGRTIANFLAITDQLEVILETFRDCCESRPVY